MYIHINIQRIYTYVCAIRRLVSFCRLFLSWVAMDQAKTQLFNIFFCIFLVIAGKLILLRNCYNRCTRFCFCWIVVVVGIACESSMDASANKKSKQSAELNHKSHIHIYNQRNATNSCQQNSTKKKTKNTRTQTLYLPRCVAHDMLLLVLLLTRSAMW